MSEVIARVISQKGTCAAGHKVGDEFVVGEKTPPKLCAWAFYSLFPFASVLQFGGSFPWDKDPNKTSVTCPDPANPVVFELRRALP
jgi:uncharacterized repeat protein (TIGR04076 family)